MSIGSLELNPDRDSTQRSLAAYRERLIEILGAIDLNEIAAVVERLHAAWESQALVVVAGNGGSAATATHMATDLRLNAGASRRNGLRAISLVDNVGVITALANDRAYESIIADQLDGLAGRDDVVILISASGNSPNMVRAAERAAELEATSIGFVGFGGGKLASLCDLVVHVGSEHGEYGPVEDLHLVCNHMICGRLQETALAETQ